MRACCAVPRLSCLASRALGEALVKSGGVWVEKREQLVWSVQHVGEAGAGEQLRLHYFLAALQGERQTDDIYECMYTNIYVYLYVRII